MPNVMDILQKTGDETKVLFFEQIFKEQNNLELVVFFFIVFLRF